MREYLRTVNLIAIFTLALALCHTTRAQDSLPGPLLLIKEADTSSMFVYPEFWVDSLNNWTLDSLQAYPPLQDLPDSSYSAPKREHVIWARFHIKSVLPNTTTWYLIDNSQSDSLLLWEYDSSTLKRKTQTGSYVKGDDRAVELYNIIAVPITIGPQDSLTYYIRLNEADSDFAELALRIVNEKEWLSYNNEGAMVFIWAFISVVGFMALYSFMVFAGTQDSTYLHYALYLLSIACFLAFAGGPHALTFNPRLTETLLYAALSGISIFYFLFARKFVHLPKHSPGWDRFLRVYIWLRVALAIVQLWIVWNTRRIDYATQLEFSFFMIDALITLALYPSLIKLKSRVAWFFIMGSAVVFVFALAYMGISVVILDESPNFQIFFMAVLIEILIFSLGLGFRVRDTEREKLSTEQALNAELSKINTAFGRFVPHEFIQSLGHSSVLDVKLGDGVEKEVAVLFSDIRGYTTLAEQMTPQENFRFLNAYLGRMGPVLKEAGGFVNQYYGDGVMALFIDSPQASVRAAVRMFEVLRDFNEVREAAGKVPIDMGIGIHIGNLMMGV
ncbi:MAG: 7TM diverse intracellular signaling domain-containing protein, partial [Bacteroidota bacterium]